MFDTLHQFGNATLGTGAWLVVWTLIKIVALVLPFSLLDWHAWYLYNYLQMMPGYAFPSLFPLFALLAGMTALACALIAPNAAAGREVA